jgi:putative ABC transport system permease protein
MYTQLKLIYESFIFAMSSVVVNKLRTLLSLLGITIGIFAIIAVFTIVDSLEINVRNSINSLGSNIIYIHKWPWTEEAGGDYQWWKYVNRPVPTFEEYEMISYRSTRAQNICFLVSTSLKVKFEDNIADNTRIYGVSKDVDKVRTIDLSEGRYFSPFEITSGRNLVVIGQTVAKNLFPNMSPTGKLINVEGFKLRVIGVIAKEGKSTFSESMDEAIIIPVNYIRNVRDIRRENMNPEIWAIAKENVSIEELKDEMRMLLRSIRRLKPNAEDNFALNQTSLINRQLDGVFKTLNIAGWFIGIFSLLVGGFGIANIMFVGVKERTNQIGIQKALGAKRSFILNQFLFESVFLGATGGIIGLLLVWTGVIFINFTTDFSIVLTLGNIFLGLSVSSFIGLFSGLAPAWSAARLDPVTAINTSF